MQTMMQLWEALYTYGQRLGREHMPCAAGFCVQKRLSVCACVCVCVCVCEGGGEGKVAGELELIY